MRTSYCERVVYLITDTDMVRAHEIRIPYDGPWAEAKDIQNLATAQGDQLTFDKQLMDIFQSQYANQKSTLDYLQGQLKPIIDAGGKGFSDAELASMRTSATDTNAQQFQNAQDALQNKITQMSGGSKLTGVSGATIQSEAALNSAEAAQQASSQEAITSANAQLKNSNYWKAISVLNGTAALTDPLGYAGAATSGTGAVAGISNAYNNSGGSGMGAIGSIFGGLLGATGGII